MAVQVLEFLIEVSIVIHCAVDHANKHSAYSIKISSSSDCLHLHHLMCDQRISLPCLDQK